MARTYTQEVGAPMSNAPREDVRCPFCQVDPPFTIRADGMKIERRHYGTTAQTLDLPPTVTVCRRPWEMELTEHMATRHRGRWLEMVNSLAISSAKVAS